jgi:dinuclear metal center YbgI/SA1388 family protein
MKLEALLDIFEKLAPLQLSEEWDNTGLLVRPLSSRSIKTLLLTIDLTESVLEEALDKKVEMILAYHPLLFHPLRRMDSKRSIDRILMQLVKSDIALYSPHTALDSAQGGVNDWLASGLGKGSISPISPAQEKGTGSGRILHLEEKVDLELLAQRIKQHLGIQTLRIARAKEQKSIQTIALCAGAGADILQSVQADCYLTGEMGHHHVLAAVQRGIHVVLSEHTHTERGYLTVLKKQIEARLPEPLCVFVSEADADPLQPHH